jgi:hypothetical protein
MDSQIDLLQIKIEQAKAQLPPETLAAIAAVDWKGAIFSLREKRGYNFEQLGELETETELLLCGLVSPKEYPKELEKRMGLGRGATDELVNEMNELVFKKIREEMIKRDQRRRNAGQVIETKVPTPPPAPKTTPQAKTPEILEFHDKPNPIPEVAKPELAGSVLPKIEPKPETKPILEKKLSGAVQNPPKTSSYGGKDPYRLPPE